MYEDLILQLTKAGDNISLQAAEAIKHLSGKIIVEVSRGMAYSDDERVEIIDHDHREDSCSED